MGELTPVAGGYYPSRIDYVYPKGLKIGDIIPAESEYENFVLKTIKNLYNAKKKKNAGAGAKKVANKELLKKAAEEIADKIEGFKNEELKRLEWINIRLGEILKNLKLAKASKTGEIEGEGGLILKADNLQKTYERIKIEKDKYAKRAELYKNAEVYCWSINMGVVKIGE